MNAIVTTSNLHDTMTLADAFVRSGFFADAKSEAQAIVKILAGQELGFGPMASMTGVYIVKGKVSLSANLMAAAVKNGGRYNYRVRKLDDTVAEVEFFERSSNAWESIGVSRFTMDDAKAAGLLGNSTWKQYPRNMLFARAISNGVKWYTPDIFGGPIYTPDELGAIVDGETGEIIDGNVTPITVLNVEQESANPEDEHPSMPLGKPQRKGNGPLSSDELFAYLNDLRAWGHHQPELKNGWKGAFVGHMDRLTGEGGHNSVAEWAFGVSSANDWDNGILWALKVWLAITKDENGEWFVDEMAAAELVSAYAAAQVAAGQSVFDLEAAAAENPDSIHAGEVA